MIKYYWQAKMIKDMLEDMDNLLGEVGINGDRGIGYRITWTWKENDKEKEDSRPHKRKMLDEAREMILEKIEQEKVSTGSGLTLLDKIAVSGGQINTRKVEFDIG